MKTFILLLAAALAPATLVAQSAQIDPDPSPPREVRIAGSATVTLEDSGIPGAMLPVIRVWINGRGPFRFGVETGAGFVGIAAHVVDSARLRPATGGTPARMLADSVTMTGASFVGVPLFVLPNAATGVDGILGLPFFADVLLTIDYPAGTVRLERGALPAANGRDILALGRDGPFWTIPLTFGDHATHAVLDTRSTGGFGMTPRLADSLSFDGPLQVVGMARGAAIAPTEVKAGTLAGAIRVGQFSFPKPTVTVRELPVQLPQGALFGSQVLRHFTVTLDQRNATLRLARAGSREIALAPPGGAGPSPRVVAAAPGPDQRPPRRLGAALAFLNGGAQVRIDLVQPGSLAERLGLQVGDLLVEIDGKRVAELSEAQLGEILRSWRAMPLVVERGGRRVSVALPDR